MPESTTASPTITVRHLLTLGVWVIGLAVAAYLFGPLKNLVLGVIATGAVAAALHPLMKYVPGPRTLRAVIVGLLPALLAGGILFLGYALLAKPIATQLGQLPQAQDSIDATLAGWSAKFQLSEPLKLSQIAQHAGDALTGGGVGKLFTTVTQAAGGALVAGMFVFFGSVYMLADNGEQVLPGILKLLPAHRREPFKAALHDMVPKLRWWLLGALIGMTAVGVAAGLGYWLVGLNLALPLALIMGVSELVPTLGPASAFVVAVMFAASQGGGAVFGVCIVYAVVQFFESYILVPLVMREAVHMPPLVTLFTIILWGQVFGATGLLLAIPINIVIWSLLDHLVIRPSNQAISVTG